MWQLSRDGDADVPASSLALERVDSLFSVLSIRRHRADVGPVEVRDDVCHRFRLDKVKKLLCTRRTMYYYYLLNMHSKEHC